MLKKYWIWIVIALLVVAIIAINWKAIAAKAAASSPADNGNGGSGTAGNGSAPAGSGSGTSTTSVPVNTTPAIPKALIDAIYNDCTCWICMRNNQLYAQLLALDDKSFEYGYYYWDQVYKADTNHSLIQEILAQGTLNSQFSDYKTQIRNRAAKLYLS